MQKLKFSIGEGLDSSKFGRETRYRCPQCKDSGWVTIWTPKTIQSAIQNPDQTRWKTCISRCECSSSGAELFRAGQRAGEPIPTFGEKPWHIDANTPDSKADAATYVHRPEGYNPEFEAFEVP